jgi:UDP-glucose 4-epimerase
MNTYKELSGRHVLVTGANGFIGRHLCRKLNENNCIVHGVSRSIVQKMKDSVQWWKGDLSDSDFVQQLFTDVKPDYIFHLASHVVGSRDLTAVLPTYKANATAAINILISAAELNCTKIVMVGSQEEPEKGGARAIPCSPYAAAKWCASSYARMFHSLYDTPVTIARVFMVYGPGQKDINKLVPYVILSLLKKNTPKLSSGIREIDWIYVEDVVDGLVKMALASGTEGETIDLGSGTLITIQEIVNKITSMITPDMKPSFGSVADRPMEKTRIANTDDTFSRTGWQPKVSLEQGLARTIEWYRRYHA